MFKKYVEKLKSVQEGKLFTWKTPGLIYQFFIRIIFEQAGRIRARKIPMMGETQFGNYFLRVAKKEELAQILAIYSSIFKDPVEEKHLESLYSSFPQLFFVLVINDRIIGYLVYKILPAFKWQSGPHLIWELWLYSIAINPDHRKKGLGKMALLETMRFLRESGPSTMKLYVNETNQGAINLYRDLGFRIIGNNASDEKIEMSVNLLELDFTIYDKE